MTYIQRSIFSVFTLLIFAFFALGSLNNVSYEEKTTKLSNGMTLIEQTREEYVTKIQGKLDSNGKLDGPVTRYDTPPGTYKEYIEYDHGIRHGWTVEYEASTGNILHSTYYHQGEKSYPPSNNLIPLFPNSKFKSKLTVESLIIEEDLAHNSNTRASTFNSSKPYYALEAAHPWFITRYTHFDNGLSTELLNNFLIELNSEINAELPDTDLDFATSFLQLQAKVGEKDTFKEVYKAYSHIMASENLITIKGYEYRLALIQRYRQGSQSSYTIIQNSFPDYLARLKALGLSNANIQSLFTKLDKLVDADGAINTASDNFISIVDERFNKIFPVLANDTDNRENAAMLIDLLQFGYSGDPIYQALKKTYFLIPIATVSDAQFIPEFSALVFEYVQVMGQYYRIVMKDSGNYHFELILAEPRSKPLGAAVICIYDVENQSLSIPRLRVFNDDYNVIMTHDKSGIFTISTVK